VNSRSTIAVAKKTLHVARFCYAEACAQRLLVSLHNLWCCFSTADAEDKNLIKNKLKLMKFAGGANRKI